MALECEYNPTMTNDDKKDVIINIQNTDIIVFPEQGYSMFGLSFEDMQDLSKCASLLISIGLFLKDQDKAIKAKSGHNIQSDNLEFKL